MTRKDILLAAPARTGNVFLAACLNTANQINNIDAREVVISGHLRSPTILSFDQSDDVKIYTNFRNPLDMIISSTIRKMFFSYGKDYKYDPQNTVFTEHITHSINDYMEYIKFQNKYMKASIILFDHLTSNPNQVVQSIFDDIKIEYVHHISPEKIKEEIHDRTKKSFIGSEPEGDFAVGYENVPYGVKSLVYYNDLRDQVLNTPNFIELNDLYDKTLELALSGACKVI